MKQRCFRFFLPFVLLVFIPLYAESQGGDPRAREILDQMLRRYQAEIAEVDDYVVETDDFTIFHRKIVTDGWPSFSVRVDSRRRHPGMADMAESGMPSLFDRSLFEQLREQADYAGRRSVDGRMAHGIRAARVEGFFGGREMEAIEDLLLIVDEETLDLSRLRAGTQVPGPDGRPQPLTVSVRLEDYREVHTMRIPFKTTVTVEGMASGISEADREQARQMLLQLEQAPPEHRAMMERMIPPGQLEQARQVLSGEPMTLETTVRQVRVNTERSDTP